jgi:V8-like Glu-specific endopeptidase
MWTFDNFPADAVKTQYGATITKAWLDQTRLATVRLAGCTGSFVSPNGLVLTNHHCVASCLNDLSTPEQNFRVNGYVAHNVGEERKCARQIADVLVATENITTKVSSATRGLSDQAANDLRKKTLTTLEERCENAGKQSNAPVKCESVSLYNGGQYFLYKYKRYTDLRLVFAPEEAIAAFGGDPDNFQFPRWCLDMSMLRAYEDGQPVKSQNFLHINFAGAKPGELVFVSGHPGSTERLLTVNQLLDLRNRLPATLLRSSELRGRYIQFAKTGAEQDRIADQQLQSLENGIKVRRKQLDALLDERLLNVKSKQEAALRSAVTNNKELAARTGSAWDDIARANKIGDTLDLPYAQLEGGAAFQSQLFRYARQLLRGAEERTKLNTDRLREFSDARLPRLQQQLLAATPIYPDLEKLTLSFSLERMREFMGPDHKWVQALLAKDSPDSLATKLVDGSKLGDPAVRAKLWQGSAVAVAASDDPMINLARLIDADARALRKQVEDQVEAPLRVATERIAAARFAILGTKTFPDATFTLRLNYGTVRGWKEGNRDVAPMTQLSRLFERATGADPFRVPESWLAVREQLDLTTPFNFSTTNDIVGGNSGSPLVNARGELVGLMFDGNIHSISGAFWFDTELNRAVAVHPAIMKVALEKVYRADALLKELSGSQ